MVHFAREGNYVGLILAICGFIADGDCPDFGDQEESTALVSSSWTDLITLSGHGDLLRVYFWLSRGVNPDCLDSQGDSALHCAVYNGNLAVAALLLWYGADPDYYPDTDWTSPVLYTLAAEDTRGTTVPYLAQSVMVVGMHRLYGYMFELDDDTYPLLQASCYGGNALLVRWFLWHGSNPNHVTEDYQSPLETAENERDESVVRLLTRAGATPRIQSGDTHG